MIYLGRSIALFPFWRFDAKRGEVVLLGLRVGFAWVRAHAYAFTILVALVSIYVELIRVVFSVELMCVILCA